MVLNSGFRLFNMGDGGDIKVITEDVYIAGNGWSQLRRMEDQLRWLASQGSDRESLVADMVLVTAAKVGMVGRMTTIYIDCQ